MINMPIDVYQNKFIDQCKKVKLPVINKIKWQKYTKQSMLISGSIKVHLVITALSVESTKNTDCEYKDLYLHKSLTMTLYIKTQSSSKLPDSVKGHKFYKFAKLKNKFSIQLN